MRPLVVVLTVALATWAQLRPALARPTDAEEAKAQLDVLATGTRDQRVAAAAALAELAPRVLEPLAEFLRRPRTSKLDERRNVLKKIKASIPDKSGKFSNPGREKADKVRADDEFDWLPVLYDLDPATPTLGEVIADIAAIRALAASRMIDAARTILDVGFSAETMIYRDDCGRQLRKMTPYSVPALIVGSQSKKNKALAKYTNYQLERIDRQDAHKALAAAVGDEALQIAILEAYGSTEHREAVPAVFTIINDEAPRVRAAARAAWLAYVTGPPPAAAPKKHLVLTGGRKASKATPLWLTSLELARVELERRTDELFAEVLAEDASLEQATQRIFGFYDIERGQRDAAVFADGKAKAAAGNLAGAIEVYDRLLAEDPSRADRAEMTPVYFARAEDLAGAERWAEAAAMYSKAHGLDPQGERATEALAAHYFTLGKAAVADGKDGSASFRKAVELRPDYAEAQAAVKSAAPTSTKPGKQWMLYAAAAVALGALVVLGYGLRRRRVHA